MQLRADYNLANVLCNPTTEGLDFCKAAAAAWARYQSASAALDTAQTSLQEAAVSGPTAQQLKAAKANFAARQAAANEVVSGKEWAAHAAAAAKLQAATAALKEAEEGVVSAQMHAAHADYATAQDASQVLLSTAGQEYLAVREAKHAVKAARSGLKAATGVARLSPEDLAAAHQDLSALLVQVQRQQEALAAAAASDPATPAYSVTASADLQGLVRFDRINVGMELTPGGAAAMLGVSYSGAVSSGQQQMLMGHFMVDASDSGSDELGLMVGEVLRDDALSGIKATHRSLAALM